MSTSLRWQRRMKRFKPSDPAYSLQNFDQRSEFNAKLSPEVKYMALKASPSIVCLMSFTGGKLLCICSGTIIDNKLVEGTYSATILTSCTLLRSSGDGAELASDLRVKVYIDGGKEFEGTVLHHNLQYNIATIGIISDIILKKASIRHFDYSLVENPSEFGHPKDMVSGSECLQHSCPRDAQISSSLYHIYPGDMVVALGRHFEEPYCIMAAPGQFSLDCCNLDCEELFVASCKITQAGIGGPLVNCYGEIIGINFYGDSYTPFLPFNIASKCLEQLNKYGCIHPPWLGMGVKNVYEANLGKFEKVVRQFGDISAALVCYEKKGISKALLVEEVEPDSPAQRAGLIADDVIVQCDGNLVGFLQCLEMAWEKVGKSLELVVLRPSSGATFKTEIIVEEANLDSVNRWEFPEEVWRDYSQLLTPGS